jgi:alkanesulfonate monooxygenase SsuD/methylene tetrahydromethanopterin reductase-like flavin-dependent oxidoreductase (luciferase family)
MLMISTKSALTRDLSGSEEIRMAANHRVTFGVKTSQANTTYAEPMPVQAGGPPIMIGAAGNRSLLVVARHANIWNCPTRGDVATFRDLSRILNDHCADIGRDPAEIERSVQLLVTASRSATPAAQPGLPQIADAATTRDLVLEFIDAGVTHVRPRPGRVRHGSPGPMAG